MSNDVLSWGINYYKSCLNCKAYLKTKVIGVQAALWGHTVPITLLTDCPWALPVPRQRTTVWVDRDKAINLTRQPSTGCAQGEWKASLDSKYTHFVFLRYHWDVLEQSVMHLIPKSDHLITTLLLPSLSLLLLDLESYCQSGADQKTYCTLDGNNRAEALKRTRGHFSGTEMRSWCWKRRVANSYCSIPITGFLSCLVVRFVMWF